MNSVKTDKGTVLPLVSLKGKDYLMVAYRIQWMNEQVPSFNITTDILKMEKDESIVKATVSILDASGRVVKTAQATKREDSKGFADHLEKAETSSIGRALALLGYGTQFAIADLDEGTRLADSPLANTKKETPVAATTSKEQVAETKTKVSSFRKQTKAINPVISMEELEKLPSSVQGWE